MKNFLLPLFSIILILSLTSCPDEPTTDYNGEQNEESSNNDNSGTVSSNGLPGNIKGKYLHLIRTDGQKLVIQHLSDIGAVIEDQEYISYIDGYAPIYSYVRKSSKSAQYSLMWTPSATPLLGGIRRYTEIILSSESSTQGSYAGTMWSEGYSSDGSPIRKNETTVKGVYYLGGRNLPEDFNKNDQENSTQTTEINKIDVISVSKTSNSTIEATFIIDVNGSFDEAGIGVIGFDNSMELYAWTVLPTTTSEFKKKCTNRYKVTPSANTQSKICSMSFKKYNIVIAYVIAGDKVHKDTMEF